MNKKKKEEKRKKRGLLTPTEHEKKRRGNLTIQYQKNPKNKGRDPFEYHEPIH